MYQSIRHQTFTVFCMLYVFFWVIPQRVNFICQRFGTLCLFHLHRQVGAPTYLWRWNRQSVSKCRHIKFRRRVITQKKTYNLRHHITESCIFPTHCPECWKSHTCLCNMETLLFIPRSCLLSVLQSTHNSLSLPPQSLQSTGHQYNWQHCIVTHLSVLQECGTLMTLCQCVQHVVSVWTHISSITLCQWLFCTVLTPVTCEYPHCLSLFLISLWMEPSLTRPDRSQRSFWVVPGYVVMSCRGSEWHTCSTLLTCHKRDWASYSCLPICMYRSAYPHSPSTLLNPKYFQYVADISWDVHEAHPTGGHAITVTLDVRHRHYQVCKCDNFADIMRKINSRNALYYSG